MAFLVLFLPGICSAAGPPPNISVQPSSQTVLFNESVTFMVTASSGTTMTYQWRKNSTNIVGATSSSYTISQAQSSDQADYSVKITNAGGSVISSNATLTVLTPPAITTHPQSQTVTQGQTVTLSVVASGTAPLSYQWKWNSAVLAGANSSTLTLTNVQTTNGGGYNVVVTNAYGSAFSATASLTVLIPYNTLYVDTTSDVTDGDTSSVTALLANKGADGKVSLREAITAANNTPNGPGGPDRIYFDITDPLVAGAHTINLTTALPTVTDPVLIDGTTDSYFLQSLPVVQLQGTSAGPGVSGLTISASGSTVRSLAINGFSGNGLVLAGNNNHVELSCLGVGVDGVSSFGNGQAGILITGKTNTIGGGTVDPFNVIGGNTGAGILISGTNATGNMVIGNFIGVSFGGLTMTPNSRGVRIENGASNNRIGGLSGGEANRIIGNTGAGIAVVGSGSINNALLSNVIKSNGGLGIDLNDDGVTANDLGDGDIGPNGLQNFPVLSVPTFNSSSLTLTGSLNSAASSAYRIEFFRSSTNVSDASGYGEAESYLGSVNVTTDSSGNAAFNTVLAGVLLSAGDLVTATAIRDFGSGVYGNTSEFAKNVIVNIVTTPGFNIDVLPPVALGNEFRVNTTTAGDQLVYYWSVRAVAVAPDGGFVQVWIDKNGLDGDGAGIFGQRFDANGNKLGSEFGVNTTTAGDQDNVSMAMDKDGNFIVLWDGPGDANGNSKGIWGQRFQANGTRIGGEFLANSSTAGDQYYPEVDYATNGNFVVAWTGKSQVGKSSATILQQFDANGNKLGGEILVNNFSGTDQILDSLEVRDDGSLIVTWGDNGDIYGRLFDPSGSPLNAAFLINTNLSGVQQYSIARADSMGNFVVVWESAGQDGSGNGVFGRRFAANGTPLSSEFAITTQTAGDQYGPVLAMDQFGNFVVAWTDGNALDGSAESIWMQRFDSAGRRIGSPQQVNQTTSGYQAWPVISMNRNGRLVVGWEGNGPGDSYGVFSRRYQINPVVTEGSTSSFRVSLNTSPTASVTLNFSVSDTTEASLSTSSVTFTPANWNVPQTVTINALQDWVVDGDQALSIITGAGISSDPAYNGLNPEDIPLTVLDSRLFNNRPIANSQDVSVGQDTATPITLTGTDAENNPLTFVITTLPSHGNVGSFNTNSGTLTYTPNAGYNGGDSFNFQVNDGLTNSSSATVNVTVGPIAPNITTQPQGQTVNMGQSVSFSVVAGGTGPLRYQWKLNGSALSGATTSTLLLTNSQGSYAGDYTVVVTNLAGSATSATAALTVIPPTLPSFTSAGMSSNGFLLRLSVVTGFTYIVSASTNLQQWVPISTNAALTTSLVITDPAASNLTRRFYRAKVQ